ncbi:MAG: flagellar biosynthetic protein FliO [Oscillospiraceae bacterium]|nr:flagellar biosynthetic protein FliO [Oscillospiraceae bacterium]
MPPEQVLIFIFGTVIVLFGAYYVTYYVGLKASGQTRAGMRNRNITVLDRYSVARDKSFCVIEIAGKVYIIGMTNHTMTLLDTVDAADFAELTKEKEQAQTPWGQTAVGQYGNKLTQKVVAFIAEKLGKTPADSAESTDNPYSSADNKKEDKKFSDTLKKAGRKTKAADETEEN